MKQNKNMKSIFTVVGLVLALSLIFCLGSVAVSKKLEVHAENLVNEELAKDTESEWEGSREYAYIFHPQEGSSDKIIIVASDGFLQTSQEFAEEILKDYGDCPLLDENVKEHFGNSSLENMMNDTNAAGCAKDVITKVCQENNIDVNSAKIKELTKEQIMEIDREVFLNSDHPVGE